MSTIGVAITLPEPWRAELQQYRETIFDPMASHIPPHITLIPPVDIEDSALPEVHAHLSAVAAQHGAFEVVLHGTGTFRPVSPVVFLQVSVGIPQVEMLAEQLRQGPLGIDLSYPFHPHVTVAYGVADEVMDEAFVRLGGYSCAFEVDAFDLYLHQGDGWGLATRVPLLGRSA